MADGLSACPGSSTEPWRQIPGCSICHIQQATIESDRPMVFHVDGEPVEGGHAAAGARRSRRAARRRSIDAPVKRIAERKHEDAIEFFRVFVSS